MQHSTQRKLVRLIPYNIPYLDLNVKDKPMYVDCFLFLFSSKQYKRFLSDSETMQKGIIYITFNMHYESQISKDPIIYCIDGKSPSKNFMVVLHLAGVLMVHLREGRALLS